MSEDFPINPEDRPIETGKLAETQAAWEADRDRIVNEVLPKVDAAIARLESGAEVILGIVSLIEQIMPLVQGVAASTGSVADIAPAQCALTSLKAKAARCLTGKCG